MDLLWFILIGIAAGWLAGVLTKGRGFGPLADFLLGVVGALVGGFLFRLVGWHAYGLVGNLAMSVVGAVAFLSVVRAIKRA